MSNIFFRGQKNLVGGLRSSSASWLLAWW